MDKTEKAHLTCAVPAPVMTEINAEAAAERLTRSEYVRRLIDEARRARRQERCVANWYEAFGQALERA